MNAAGNTLADFPAETFTIYVYCDACERRGPLDRAKVPTGMTIQHLVKALRCSRCGSHEASTRIVYTGADGFAYGDKHPLAPPGLRNSCTR
jgi:hypothetical protein